MAVWHTTSAGVCTETKNEGLGPFESDMREFISG